MEDRVLVAFVTRYGSTQEAAEDIAATLRQHQLEVDVMPVREVRDLEGYRAVVLGAPFYIGSWGKDIDRFLSQYREALMKRPVAIFTLGPMHNDEKELQEALPQLEKELAKLSWLAPAAVEMFGGKYDPAKLRFPDSLVAKLPGSPLYHMPASDARDWVAIRAWASDLAAKLQPALAR